MLNQSLVEINQIPEEAGYVIFLVNKEMVVQKTNKLFAKLYKLTPEDVVGNMTSIGTLFAFILVCIGIIILRRTTTSLPGQFITPCVPLVPILGIIICGAMVYGLGYLNWLRLIVWILIGFIIYFSYSRYHSGLR